MQWINSIVDAAIARQPGGEILVSSGASPSGTYHFGHLRELITCDAIVLEIRRRGRQARHVHVVDNLDGLRKIPVNIPAEYEKYLGMPLCDIPAPDGSDRSYADYFLDPFIDSAHALGIEVDVEYSHEKYRAGYFVPAIERSLERIPQARKALETVSGRQLDEHWTPIQIMEQGRLKNRRFVSVNTTDKTVAYIDAEGTERSVRYDNGEVKLDWRLDWPGRWWLMHVVVEPFGRDHATKGGSYDTGVQIMQDVYEAAPPIPVPYDFVNRAGDTKKMSASKGTGIHAHEAVKVLPAEVARFFMLRFPPSKRLYFDQEDGVVRLVDEFAALSAKTDRTESEEQLVYLCTRGLDHRTVSRVPFSHLVAGYQAALKDVDKTLQTIARTEHAAVAQEDAAIIKNELRFIDEWLKLWAPEDVRFELADQVDQAAFSDEERTFLAALAEKISEAPADADGSWFHLAIYDFKETMGLAPKDMFKTLYRALLRGQGLGTARRLVPLNLTPRLVIASPKTRRVAMIKAVISDVDGTQINTLYFIRHGQYEAMTEYLMSGGLHKEQLPTYDQYRNYLDKAVGGPTLDTFHQTLRLIQEDFPAIDPAKVDVEQVNNLILPRVQDRLAPLYIQPFPELDDFLRVLSTLDLKFAIYTSGYDYMIVRNFGVSIPALGYTELYKDQSFSDAERLTAFKERMKAIYSLPELAVVTADDVSAHKPDPEGVLKALDLLGVKPEEAVVLGDHRYDMMAAKRAGVYAIGTGHGFSTSEELKDAGADVVCANLHEVIYQLQYVL